MSKSLHALLVALIALVFVVGYTPSYAQLQVDGAVTAEDLAQLLVGNGVTISNVDLNCPTGAFGSFNGENTNLGLGSGVLLTSGSVNNAVGPNNNGGTTTSLGTPGDLDLDAITLGGTQDACVLEFDFIPFADEVSFRYVFGSEEYLEYVGSFNDGFALFISGPGIVGQQNIAFIPSTTTPVTINNVNNVTNSEYYVDNGTGSPVDPESTIQYDGFTVVLTAIATVIPCQTYHLKIAVADALDTALDSGVFIEEGSLSTNFIVVEASALALTSAGFDTAVEGCVNGLVTFTSTEPLVEDTELSFTLGGTAVVGEDYLPVNTSFIMPAGTTNFTVPINVLEDGIPDNDVLEIIFALNFACDTIIQTAFLNIADVLPLTVSPDVTLEPGQSTTLSVSGGVPNLPEVDPASGNYTWSPASGLSSTTSANPTATPIQTTVYTVTANLGDCAISQQVTVTVQVCDPLTDGQAGFITTDVDFVCAGSSVTATANGAVLNVVDGVADVLAYVLHNSPNSDITIPGFILYGANATGVFDNGTYPTNQVLFISSIVADDDGTGFPDLTDPCISISPAYPIVFLTPVQIVVNESCDWLTGDYHIVLAAFGGYPAYNPAGNYNFTGDYFGSLGFGETIEIIILEGVATSYSFSATDANGCVAANVDEEFICYKTPIELLSYTGKVLNTGNMLTWVTATETDNDFFTLSRSIDGQHFTDIATVDGAGTTVLPVNYEYLDKAAPNGISYYRLSQTDFNGQSKVAGVVSLHRTSDTDKPIAFNFVAPVPVIDVAQVSFTSVNAGEVAVQLYDVTGRMVSNQTVMAISGNNSFVIDLSAASAGVYFLTLTNDTDLISTKLVKR